jgi:hypothetical protein
MQLLNFESERYTSGPLTLGQRHMDDHDTPSASKHYQFNALVLSRKTARTSAVWILKVSSRSQFIIQQF